MTTFKKNIIVKTFFLSLVVFIIKFINPMGVLGDACSPWVCAGTNAYLKVNNCRYISTGSGGYCANGTTTNNEPLTCTNPDCTGNAVGVDGCIGNTPTGTTYTGCTCSVGGYCGGGNGTACTGTGGYPGTCQDCISDTAYCGEARSSARGCCVASSSPSPTPTGGGAGTPTPTATPTSTPTSTPTTTPTTTPTISPTPTPLICNSICTLDTQCSSVDPAWTCDDTSGRCRMAANPTSVSCVPCVASCGGTTCGSTSATPNQVTNVRINGTASGNLDLSSGGTMNITWNDPGISDVNSNIDYYIIEIWNRSEGTTPPYPCNAASNCSTYNTTGKVESYTTTASANHDNDIYVAVRAVNDTCVSVGYGAWSSSSTMDLVTTVTGFIYDDPNASPDAFNNCVSSSTTLVDVSAYPGSTITTSVGGTATLLTSSYTIEDLPYAPDSSWADYGFEVTLNLDNSVDPANPIICACPVDLLDPYSCVNTNTSSPSSSQNIYVTSVNLSSGPWWQTSGGNIFGASSLISAIPDACAASAVCKEYLSTQNSDGDINSAGVPITGASSISSNGHYTEMDGAQPRSLNADHSNLIRENYDYFARNVNLTSARTVAASITAIPSNATADADGNEFYYRNGNLTVDLSSTATINSGRKIVMFVNGNITFTSDPDVSMIDVAEGSFIGFISSGNITFDANVGNTVATDTSSNIEGVFIADGSIRVDGYSDAPINDDTLIDNKFVGEGTFVGWSGFSLSRDYENTANPLQKVLNNTNPIELFVFRPDFNLHTPTIMMSPSLVWQEVN